MKKVITFVEEGNKELIYEGQKLDEWHKTVKKLKLEGQKDFASNEDKSPIPFRALSSADMHFINELCPSTQAVKDYSKTLIPLEVLSLVSLATTEKYFTEIYVYYGDKNHPFMIGQTGESYSDRRYFLIGAWNFTGTFKWEDVVKRAKKSYLERRKNKMEVAMNEIQKDLDNLPNLCDKWARGEWVTESYSG